MGLLVSWNRNKRNSIKRYVGLLDLFRTNNRQTHLVYGLRTLKLRPCRSVSRQVAKLEWHAFAIPIQWAYHLSKDLYRQKRLKCVFLALVDCSRKKDGGGATVWPDAISHLGLANKSTIPMRSLVLCDNSEVQYYILTLPVIQAIRISPKARNFGLFSLLL